MQSHGLQALQDLWNQDIQDNRDQDKMSEEIRQAIRKAARSQQWQ